MDLAETAWDEAMMTILRQFTPDTGWRGEALLPIVERAVRTAGGVRFLWSCASSPWQLMWAREKFLAAYRSESAAPDVVEVTDVVADETSYE